MSQIGNRVDHELILTPPPLVNVAPSNLEEIEQAKIARKRLDSNQKRYSIEEKQAFLANLEKSQEGK